MRRLPPGLVLAAALVVMTGGVRAEEGPAVVIVVRHAEKAARPADDPPLSPAGTARAEALASALANARVDAIITTQFRRTRETAAPLARARGLTPQVVPAGGDADAHAREVATAVRRQPANTVVLVVGHSNTVPAIVAALGGPPVPALQDHEYARLFTLLRTAGDVRLVSSTYGASH